MNNEMQQFCDDLLLSALQMKANQRASETALKSFLKPRIEAAEQGNVINKSVTQIFADEMGKTDLRGFKNLGGLNTH